MLNLTVNICGEDIPLYNDPSRGRDFASNDEGECDSLYTRGTGGGEYAISGLGTMISMGEPSQSLTVLVCSPITAAMTLVVQVDGKLIDEGDELFVAVGPTLV